MAAVRCRPPALLSSSVKLTVGSWCPSRMLAGVSAAGDHSPEVCELAACTARAAESALRW